jgi:hypothetical protein
MKTFKFSNVTDFKMESAKRRIIAEGGSIMGSSFTVKGIKGTYSLDMGSLRLEITDKPWLASWGMIEDGLRKFFR